MCGHAQSFLAGDCIFGYLPFNPQSTFLDLVVYEPVRTGSIAWEVAFECLIIYLRMVEEHPTMYSVGTVVAKVDSLMGPLGPPPRGRRSSRPCGLNCCHGLSWVRPVHPIAGRPALSEFGAATGTVISERYILIAPRYAQPLSDTGSTSALEEHLRQRPQSTWPAPPSSQKSCCSCVTGRQ